MLRPSRKSLLLVSSLCVVGLVIVACSGDDATTANDADSGGGDDTSPVIDSGIDATIEDAAASDAGTKDASVTDSGDAGFDAESPAHVVFVTTAPFDPPSGDLLSFGGDGGKLADGGLSPLAAADSVCTAAGHSAGFAGAFVALLTSGTENGLSRIADSDGPWALVDGTPVAQTAAELTNGYWHFPIALSQDQELVNGDNAVWTLGHAGVDCEGWTSADASAKGIIGVTGYIAADGLIENSRECDLGALLYCAQVGNGGGANHYPAFPAGGKLAFVTDVTLPGNFANGGAAIIDGGAVTGAHAVADAVCNQVARGKGTAGTFRGWIADSTTDAVTYFSGLSMDGPWVRADGFKVADSLAALTDATDGGPVSPISLGPSGAFATSVQNFVWTGANVQGQLESDNCANFTTTSGASAGFGGLAMHAKTVGLFDPPSTQCTNIGTLYCFQQ